MQYITAFGNLGDSVIALGVPSFVGQRPHLNDRALFRGGAFEPHSDVLVYLDEVPRNVPLTILPSTFGDQTAATLRQFRDVEVMCRDPLTFDLAKRYGLRASLEQDLAFYVDYSPWKDQPGEGVLNCFRGDIESATNYRPADNRDLSAERNEKWTLESCQEPAKYFIGELAKYAEIRTDRLHVAIVGALLGKKVEFYGGAGAKNSAVFTQSLEKLGNVTFHSPNELPVKMPVRGMIIHQHSRQDRKDPVRALFKDVGNCGVIEAIVPDWDTAANRAVRGCSLTHIHAVQLHLHTNTKWLLVLEDDAVMLPTFRTDFLELDPSELPQDCLALVLGGDCENVKLSGGKFMKILPPFWGSHAVLYNMDLVRKTDWVTRALFIAAIRQLGPDQGPNGICYESLLMLATNAAGQFCYRMRSMSFTTTGGFSARSQSIEPPRSVALNI